MRRILVTSPGRASVELREFLRLLRRQWIWITLVTLIGLGLAVLLTALTPKTYAADSTAFVSVPVSAPTTTGTSALADAAKFAQTRAKSYVGLSDSALVLQPVIDDLKLNITVATLASEVSATNPVDTVLINIRATDKNKIKAAEISSGVANQMKTVIESLEQARGSTQSQVKVTITKPASTPTSPVSPKPVLNYALGLVIGLALGVA
ncbi:MAG: polysaccharide biosynthesis tyrosine autokinase, partial [Pseudonocardiales bacterium]|nr:polysaccharide biosynthesis tyrosine autokinase [Pseudonocardiales bacterium]